MRIKDGVQDNFDAKLAREIVEDSKRSEIHEILVGIKRAAELGKTVFRVKKSLKKETKEDIVKRGFRLVEQSGSSMQIDGHYYDIYWDKE